MGPLSWHGLAAVAVLLAVAAFSAESALRGRARHSAFKALATTGERQAALRRRVVRSFVQYGLASLAGLAAIGRFDAIWRLPPEIGEARDRLALQYLGLSSGETLVVGQVLAAGVVVGSILAGLGVSVLIARLRPGKLMVLGDVRALLPRNAGEMRWCGLLAVNAGVSEELYFRLLAPLALSALTHDFGLAMAVSVVVFGLCHAYQGWAGVTATTVMGALLAGIYLLSGSLAFAMAFHVLIDLRGLVLTPLLMRWAEGTRGGAAASQP
jgi:membrane protease YdiL (CAAX protease family)